MGAGEVGGGSRVPGRLGPPSLLLGFYQGRPCCPLPWRHVLSHSVTRVSRGGRGPLRPGFARPLQRDSTAVRVSLSVRLSLGSGLPLTKFLSFPPSCSFRSPTAVLTDVVAAQKEDFLIFSFSHGHHAEDFPPGGWRECAEVATAGAARARCLLLALPWPPCGRKTPVSSPSRACQSRPSPLSRQF